MMEKMETFRYRTQDRKAIARRAWATALWCTGALVWGVPATEAVEKTVQHVVGTVSAIDQKRLVVTTFKGQTVSIKLTKQVRYKDKTNPQSNRPPVVGDRVIVEAVRDNKILTA
ncbi:MAG: DUF5666 domain-containing protein, partial [Nitrospira sp.]|nr:DUF5666 domain-containing protein [Nitrospira sp.]